MPLKNQLRITIPPDLPYLTRDPFNWTQAELDDATEQAKLLLFATKHQRKKLTWWAQPVGRK